MRDRRPVERPRLQRVRELALQPKLILEKRRSGRLQNQSAPNYNEAALDKADAISGHRQDGMTPEGHDVFRHCTTAT